MGLNRTVRRILRPVRRFLREYRIAKLLLAILVIWLLGALLLFSFEGRVNPEFDSFPSSLWNIAVYLFSG
ncbi:hypothetical protein JW921_01775, partial [Candidatus Fermentibacterales bacterium]|nr:hypothetical protein [Candidatus Fermentibacterales bacterium]